MRLLPHLYVLALALMAGAPAFAGAAGRRESVLREMRASPLPPGADGVSIAVLDSVVDPSRDAVFECTRPGSSIRRCERIIYEANFAPGNSRDVAGATDHGTMVAAAIASAAPGVRLIALNVDEVDPEFGVVTSSHEAVIAALAWVRAHAREYRIVAANLSLGWPNAQSGRCDEGPLAEAVRRTREAGVAVVAAVGNSHAGASVALPACVTATTSVGALEGEQSPGVLASFTNRHGMVDFYASGAHVPAGHDFFGGTSASASVVSAAIGRLQAEAIARTGAPLSVDEVEETLRLHTSHAHDDPEVQDGRDFLALVSTARGRPYTTEVDFGPGPVGAPTRDIVLRARGATKRGEHVRSAFLSLEVESPRPETVMVTVRAPDARVATVALPSAARGDPRGDDLGGDFNGILEGSRAPEALGALAGASGDGDWELRIQTRGPPPRVVRAILFLTTGR